MTLYFKFINLPCVSFPVKLPYRRKGFNIGLKRIEDKKAFPIFIIL